MPNERPTKRHTFSGADGDGDEGLVELGGQVLDASRRIVAEHGAHEDGRVGPHLRLDDARKVEQLLGLRQEAVAEDGGDEALGQRDEAVGPEGLGEQELAQAGADGGQVRREAVRWARQRRRVAAWLAGKKGQK